MSQQITGLGSGLDTNSIIAQLVAIERRSQDRIRARGTQAQVQLTNYQAVRGLLSGIRTASQSLIRGTDWQALSATSSNTDAVGVTASSGTVTGSVSFSVDRLATAASSRSVNVLNGTTAVAAQDASIFVSAGGARLGLRSIASNDSLSIGSHSIEVTQASAAAVKQGGGALAASTVIHGSNNEVDLTVNGTAYSLTIASGTYTRAQLADALQTAADAAGAAIDVTLDSDTNILSVSTAREGSAASIQITGGDALTDLGLATDGSAITGTDALVSVDGGATVTLDSIEAGGTATLAASEGTIDVVFGSGLRVGTVTGKNVTTGDRTLGTVVANINAANAGVTAAAVQVGDGKFRLQLAASQTGADHASSIAGSEFAGAVGGMVTLSAGADAKITVGTGPGAYSITNSANTIRNLLPGVDVSLKKVSEEAVTIGVQRDGGAMADKVAKLVQAVNSARDAISTVTRYDPSTKQASPLTGDGTMRRLVSDLSLAVTSATSWATPGSPGLAGVSVDRTGKYTFDRSAFLDAFNADPAALARVFTQGGTASSGSVEFISAGERAEGGTYDLVVTTPAAQARATGLADPWPPAELPTVKVRLGSKEVTYAVGVGNTRSDVATALNAAFAGADLDLTASASGDGVTITSSDYGSAARFEVDWGAGYATHTGTDVAGTIGGITGTGTGQQLAIPFDNPVLGGLALRITATAAGALGTFEYQPGAAQRLATTVGRATDVVTGYLTTAEKAKQDRIKFVGEAVNIMESRLVQFEKRLRRQFSALDSVLGSMKNQGGFLSGQLSGAQAATPA